MRIKVYIRKWVRNLIMGNSSHLPTGRLVIPWSDQINDDEPLVPQLIKKPDTAAKNQKSKAAKRVPSQKAISQDAFSASLNRLGVTALDRANEELQKGLKRAAPPAPESSSDSDSSDSSEGSVPPASAPVQVPVHRAPGTGRSREARKRRKSQVDEQPAAVDAASRSGPEPPNSLAPCTKAEPPTELHSQHLATQVASALSVSD